MGCLFSCLKKKSYVSPTYDDEPAKPILEATPIVNDNDNDNNYNEETDSFDEQKAKSLVRFLLSSPDEPVFYRSLLPEVLNLSSEEFRQLFEGNSDYDFNVKNKEKFHKLALKFDNFSILLSEWYKKGQNYHECLKDIWNNNNDLNNLKNLDEYSLEKKLNNLCVSKFWTNEIKDDFKRLINFSNDLSEKFQVFLQEQYTELDDIIKNIKKSKKAVETKEKENNEKKNLIFDESTKSVINTILDSVISEFFESIKSEYNNNNISTEESNKITKFTENEKQNLIKKVALKYATGDLGQFNLSNALETAKDLSTKINYCKLFSKDTKKKIDIIANNKIAAHAILGLSFLSLCNNIYSTYKLFQDSRSQIKELNERLNVIESNFKRHKNEIPFINGKDCESDMKKIEEVRLKFEEDKDNLEQLINDIDSALAEQKSEKNKRIYQAIYSTFLTLGSGLAGGLSKGSSKIEYASAGIFSGIGVVNNIVDIGKLQKNISDYKKLLKKARNLENEIQNEIKSLNKKYIEAQKGHLPDIYREY